MTSRVIDYLCGVIRGRPFGFSLVSLYGRWCNFRQEASTHGIFFIIFKMDLSFFISCCHVREVRWEVHAWATRGEWWSRMWDHLIDEDHKVGRDDVIRRWFLLGQKGSLLFVLWEKSQNSLWWREKDTALCLFFMQVSWAENQTCKYAT